MITVREAPGYLNQGFYVTRMDLPGPARLGTKEGLYLVYTPQEEWDQVRQAACLRRFNEADLYLASLHEALPGRYLMSLYATQAPTEVRQMLTCRSALDGWASYVERVMLEELFETYQPELRLAHLRRSLVEDCRLLASLRIHTQGMTVEEATQLFIERAFQDPVVARVEAMRAVHDPMYFVSLLGRLEIFRLREDYQRTLGTAYTLQRFHEGFLANGPIPIKLTREMMLPSS